MTVVFGVDVETLAGLCEEVKDTGCAQVANHNSSVQVVLTGEKEALQNVAQLAKKKGAKLIVPLKVSGPWHSRFMAEASEQMRDAFMDCSIASPSFPVLSNVTADVYSWDSEQIREALLTQMLNPVLWNDSIRRFALEGYRLFVEVGPGKVLTGLMRDIDRALQILNTEDPEVLSKLRNLASESPPLTHH
jgi:[acyl-carrier-protein] S-malonyltransferase